MSRDAQKLEMRERILATADRLFYGQGIRAIGVDTIAAEVGISKRTLYNHFVSKDALIEAYLERRFRPNTLTDAPPVEQILEYFERIERGIGSRGFRGCPFVNAVAEIGSRTHPAGHVALRFKEQQRLWVRTLLERTDAREPDALATQIAILIDGAIATALVRGDPNMARAARDAALVLIRNAGAVG